MAAANLTSTDKFNVYDRLAQINRSFDFTTDNLVELKQYGILDKTTLDTFCGLTKELQALLNYKLISTLLDVEGKDSFEFGKVRIAWEHRLNPDRPAFRKSRK